MCFLLNAGKVSPHVMRVAATSRPIPIIAMSTIEYRRDEIYRNKLLCIVSSRYSRNFGLMFVQAVLDHRRAQLMRRAIVSAADELAAVLIENASSRRMT